MGLMFKNGIPYAGVPNEIDAATVNGHTVESDVPADAKFTDTVYDDAELVTKVGILETSLNGHTVKADVPENAEFTDTVYTHPTTSGNKHIPSGGSSGQILRWASDGIAYWGNDVDTTYSTFGKSGPDASLGLVPKPPTTPGYSKYLREDCTWAEADEELNSSSKNPIQNQAVYFEIFGLNARLKSHTHKVEDIYDIGFSSEEVVKAIEWVIHLDETPEYVKESVAKANEVHYVSGRIGYTVGTESAKIELGFVPTAIWVSNISTDKNVINISRTNDVNTYFTVPAEVSGLVTGTLCYVAFK